MPFSPVPLPLLVLTTCARVRVCEPGAERTSPPISAEVAAQRDEVKRAADQLHRLSQLLNAECQRVGSTPTSPRISTQLITRVVRAWECVFVSK